MLFITVITGETAYSREFEDAYRLAGEPKEWLVVPGAAQWTSTTE